MKRFFALLIVLSAVIVSPAQNRYALVIGIGQYPSDSGWSEIHGDNDVELIVSALSKVGFPADNIVKLVNSKATKKTIVSALEEIRDKAISGDIVYIHFSGHGQQVTDLSGDETDHYDEAWIPYDAKKQYETDVYEGQNHILDDEINLYLNGLRSRIGPKGKIVVVSDACHSGSGSRSLFDDNDPVRGTREKFVIPADLPNVIRKEAPINWLFVGACKPYQTNHEYRSPDGCFYGSLTYVIVNSLANIVEKDYRKHLDQWRTSLVEISRYPQDMDDEGQPSKRSNTLF